MPAELSVNPGGSVPLVVVFCCSTSPESTGNASTVMTGIWSLVWSVGIVTVVQQLVRARQAAKAMRLRAAESFMDIPVKLSAEPLFSRNIPVKNIDR